MSSESRAVNARASGVRRDPRSRVGLPNARIELNLDAMTYAAQGSLATSRESVSDAIWVTYRWMTLGLATTGLVALGVAHSPAAVDALITNRLLFYGLLFAQLGLVFAFSSLAIRVSTGAAALMFFAYAALTGVTFSTLFLVYTSSSIAATFFVTAGTFGALSAFGAATKRDLSAVGRFGLFALVGIILASLVNMFLQSSGLQWVITFAGVLLFAGLTAYDTQRLRALFASGETSANLPLVGALTLYLDFINMFLFLLRIFGNRRRD
jgi:FtsH-binding integral membrane protein